MNLFKVHKLNHFLINFKVFSSYDHSTFFVNEILILIYINMNTKNDRGMKRGRYRGGYQEYYPRGG